VAKVRAVGGRAQVGALAERPDRLQLDRHDGALVGELDRVDPLREEPREDVVAAAAVGHDAAERSDLPVGQRRGDEVVDRAVLGRHADTQADLALARVDEPVGPVDPHRPGEAGRPAGERGGVGDEGEDRLSRCVDRDALRV
jgi:hypothetical protein